MKNIILFTLFLISSTAVMAATGMADVDISGLIVSSNTPLPQSPQYVVGIRRTAGGSALPLQRVKDGYKPLISVGGYTDEVISVGIGILSGGSLQLFDSYACHFDVKQGHSYLIQYAGRVESSNPQEAPYVADKACNIKEVS